MAGHITMCYQKLFAADLRVKSNKLPIIGVGGIDSVIAAREKIAAGYNWYKFIPALFLKARHWIKEIVTHI